MAKKLSSVLGVDLGSRNIKVVELRTQGREPMVNAMAMVDTPEGAIDHTGVFNPEAVGAALKQAIAAAGASSPNVVVSIAGQASVLVRTLEVPRMNTTELREHMQWEINRNIPFAESNVVSDYRPLQDEDPNSPNMDVVMAISPQSAIDTLIAAVKQAKKSSAAIDVEPLSIARSMTYSFGEEYQGQTICFVDMGHKTTAINIYRDGKLLMPRQIPVGGEMVTKALADAMNLPVDEAEKLKIEKCEVPASAGADTGFGSFDMSGGFATPTMGGDSSEFQPYNPFADDSAPFSPFATTPDAPTTPADTAVAPYDPMAPSVMPPSGMPPAESSPFAPSSGMPSADASPFAPTPDFTQSASDVTAPPAMADASAFGMPAHVDPAPSAMPVATVDPEVEKLYQIIAPVLDEFVAEVRRSVDYFRSRGGDINRVIMSGGASKLKGLKEFVGRSLGLECDGYDCFRRLTLNSKKIAPGNAEDLRQEFVVAIGNALHIFFE
jgi:type IV pilus assembly protein PilM